MEQTTNRSVSEKQAAIRSLLATLLAATDGILLPQEASDLDAIKERLENALRIAVVGEFSAGKSTFLNAMIRQDVLSHGSAETTAAITYIVNVTPDDPRYGHCEVTFQSGKAIEFHAFDKLREYTTTSSNRYRVAEEIKSVAIYTAVMNRNEPFVLVDTPGLNGLAQGHSECTFEEVRRAHVCIYLLPLQGPSASDLTILRSLADYQSEFLFVQNFMDELNVSEGETPENKLKDDEKRIKSVLDTLNPPVHYSMCCISALQALVYYDQSIPCLYQGDSEISQEERQALFVRSHFGDFLQRLTALVHNQEQREVRLYTTAQALAVWIVRLRVRLEAQNGISIQMQANDPEEKRRAFFQREKERLQAGKEKELAAIDTFLESGLIHMRALIKSFLGESREKIYQAVWTAVCTNSAFEDVNGLRRLARGDNPLVADLLRSLVADLEHDYRRYVSGYVQHLRNLVQERIQKGCSASGNIGLPEFAFHVQGVEAEPYISKRDRLDQLLNRWDEMQQSLKAHALEKAKYEKEMRENRAALQDVARDKTSLAEQQQKEEQRLGERPDIECRSYETEEYEYRGGIGILDAILGPKRVTRTKWYEDSSARDEFENNLKLIRAKYERERVNCEKKSQELTQQIKRFQADIDALRDGDANLQERLQQKERDIAQERESIRIREEYARKEYMEALRRGLSASIRDYMAGLEAGFCDKLEQDINENRDSLLKIAHDFYNTALEEAIRRLELAISGQEEQLHSRYARFDDVIRTLYQVQLQLEE